MSCSLRYVSFVSRRNALVIMIQKHDEKSLFVVRGYSNSLFYKNIRFSLSTILKLLETA
jgi:hypothetical protein